MGNISAAKKTTIASTTVDTATAPAPHKRVTNSVVRDAQAIWTILVPTRSVVKARSKSSSSAAAFCARRFPSSARLLMRMRLALASAVSAVAK